MESGRLFILIELVDPIDEKLMKVNVKIPGRAAEALYECNCASHGIRFSKPSFFTKVSGNALSGNIETTPHEFWPDGQ